MRKSIIPLISLLSTIALLFPAFARGESISNVPDQFTQADSIAAAIVARSLATCFTAEMIKEKNGKIESYIVDRGETWKSIATSHGVDESMLKALNPFETECLTGMEILVPRFPEVEKNIVVDDFTRDKLQRGMLREQEGNYKEAIKIYTQILKDTESLDARYLRGRAYYRNNKLKQSVADFKYVAANDKDHRFPDALDIYRQVSDEWEKYKEERTQKWLSIGLAILDTGLKVASDVIAHKNGNNNVSAFLAGTGGYGYGGSVMPSYSAGGVAGTGTDYYHNGIQWPESLDPTKYFTPDVMRCEITYDAYGNPMYSYPGVADAMMRMQRDFNMDMAKSGNLYSGDVLSNSLLAQLNLQNRTVAQTAYEMATPMYAVEYESSGGSSDTGSGSGVSTNTSRNKKCIHCEGTGWVRHTQSGVATLGQRLGKRKCNKCGYEWNPEIEVHTCDRCKYCDAGKF